ncbi:uncharacterized protein LOC128673250 [Plodia interpunctella]|uniref:uncharacterized protein LOC128673250 n=1 Tax=Plodia interpunctella TaxID=58824 RepID=UPI002368009B|nr:uncharacterized protein LOC128673250 [Plodia interpunctella]
MANIHASWGCCSAKANEESYIVCDICVKQYHAECLGMTSDYIPQENEKWICPICKMTCVTNHNNDSTPVRFNPNVTVRPTKRQALQSPPNSSTEEAAITKEDVRAIIEEVSQQQMEGLVSQFRALFSTMLETQMKPLRDQLTDVKESVTFMSGQYDEIIKQNKRNLEIITDLQSECDGMKSKIRDLSTRLNNQEQNARSCNIEIQCVPEKKDENLITIVTKLGSIIKCNTPPESIVQCTRIAKINRNSPRPRSIVVQFCSPKKRDDFLAAVVNYNKSKPIHDKLNSTVVGLNDQKLPIFVMEHLSPANKALHAAARLAAKKKGYKHVWVRNGRIYLRKTDNSDYILVKDMDSIDNLK